MKVRKRVIAGLAALFVVFTGTIAQAMFSDDGFRVLSRGLSVLQPFVRAVTPEEPPSPQPERRTVQWSLLDQAPRDHFGDASSGRAMDARVVANVLEAIDTQPDGMMDFKAWEPIRTVEGQGVLLNGGDAGELGSVLPSLAEGQLPQSVDDTALAKSLAPSTPSMTSVALAASAATGSPMVMADPQQFFGGFVTTEFEEVVATPIPAGALLLGTGLFLVFWQHHKRLGERPALA